MNKVTLTYAVSQKGSIDVEFNNESSLIDYLEHITDPTNVKINVKVNIDQNTEKVAKGGSEKSIESRVKDVIADQLGVCIDQVELTSDLQDDLGADELDPVEILMALEEEFGVAIREELAANVRTVQDHIDMINKVLSEKKS